MIATYYVFALSSSGVDQGQRANQKYVLYNVCFKEIIVKSSLICSTVKKTPPVRKIVYSNIAEIQLQPTAILR